MKVFYKKCIFDRIREAIDEAHKSNKKIDYIKLSKEDTREFNKAISCFECLFQEEVDLGNNVCILMGVKVILEKLDDGE